MSRIWTRASVRVLAVFVLVVGLIAGAYLGIHRHRQGTPQAVQVVGEPLDPVAEQRAQHESVNGYRQRRIREEAGHTASRSAKRKADAGGENASGLAQNADDAKENADRKKHQDSADNGEPVGPVPSSCKEYSGNKATGCTLMLQAGFKIDQMTCLDKLWDRESGWNPHASNPSGAYGIPQAKPGSKMASVGDDWQDNPATQIKWGLGYIKSHYSTPCGAWQHSENSGWY